MKTRFFLLILLSCSVISVYSQKQITKNGTIQIFSETPLFTIDGVNKKVASILDTDNGEIVASTLVRSFKFEEALVEEHFNENYIESHKYPKAVFKGKIVNYKKADFAKDGNFNETIKGKLTIHGQTKDITEKVNITIKNGNIAATAEFNVSLKEYEIKVEKAYKNAIKDAILLKIKFNYKPYKKK